MFIEGISVDQTDALDIFHTKQSILWNGHEVVRLNQKSHLATLDALSTSNKSCRKLIDHERIIQPLMSGSGRVKGDISCSEANGWGGKLEVEFEFGPKEKSNTSSEQTSASSDTNSGNRNVDKEK